MKSTNLPQSRLDNHQWSDGVTGYGGTPPYSTYINQPFNIVPPKATGLSTINTWGQTPPAVSPVAPAISLNGVASGFPELGVGNAIPGYPSFDQWNGNMATNPTGGGFTAGTLGQGGGLTDRWFDMKGKGGMALGVGQLGLGAFNSWMNLKNQKFMQDYYGKEQARNVADFNNNARSSNEDLQYAQQMRNSGSGVNPDSAEGKAATAAYMDKWGAKQFA